MSPQRRSKRRRNYDIPLVLIVIILTVVAFFLLPGWVQVVITVIAIIVLIEVIWSLLFRFSLLKWLWRRLFR